MQEVGKNAYITSNNLGNGFYEIKICQFITKQEIYTKLPNSLFEIDKSCGCLLQLFNMLRFMRKLSVRCALSNFKYIF